MQRLDSARAVCDCIAALVNGDLINPSSPASAEHLLPLLPPASANAEMVSLLHLLFASCYMVVTDLYGLV